LKITDSGIRWFVFLAHTATSAFWVSAPLTLMSFGASVASQAPLNIARAAQANAYLLGSLLVIAVPWALLQVGVLLWRHRRGFAEIAPQIALNRAAISKDLAKVVINFAISAALGVFGLYAIAHGKWSLGESFLSFLTAAAICYWLIAGVLEMIKYLPIIRSLLRPASSAAR
jgi:hypothetical protein